MAFRFLHLLIALAGIWLLPTFGWAEINTYDWSDSVRLAHEQNAQLIAARSTAQAANYASKGARSNFLPEIYGSVGYERNGSGNSTVEASDGYSASLNAAQNLFSGFADIAAVRRAKLAAVTAELNLQTARAQVSYDLKSAFEGLRFAQNYTALTDEIIRRRQENLRLVELRFETGRENRGSVLLSQAYLNQAQYDALQAKHLLRTSSAALARALGLDEFLDIRIRGEVPVTPPAEKRPALPEIARETPQLQRALAAEGTAEAAITVARAGFFPSLNLAASTRRTDDQFFPRDRETWTLAANIRIPIFNGGRDYYGVKAAAESWKAATQSAYDLSRSVLTDLERSYAAYLESIAKLRADESFRTAAQARAEIGRQKYNNGLLTFEDWDVIENDLIARQKSLLQSQRDRVVAEAAWENTQGKGSLP